MLSALHGSRPTQPIENAVPSESVKLNAFRDNVGSTTACGQVNTMKSNLFAPLIELKAYNFFLLSQP